MHLLITEWSLIIIRKIEPLYSIHHIAIFRFVKLPIPGFCYRLVTADISFYIERKVSEKLKRSEK